MKEIQKRELIYNIFKEIEEAIKDSMSSKPVKLIDSKFYKRFIKIKKKYGVNLLILSGLIISLAILPFVPLVATVPIAFKFLTWVR